MARTMAQGMMPEPALHIALIHPEIPQNTGNVGRLCLGIGARLHLVHPLGFQTDQKAVRRAGLDYWKDVDVVEHKSYAAFQPWLSTRRAFCFSTKGKGSYRAAQYRHGDVLVFGSESKGLPPAVLEEGDSLCIPMPGPIRSLNLSNAVAVAAYAALAEIDAGLF
jgi:tRNA (cytidine/uridine-2'-O-)-methyltransferase